jgi:glycosyltransferase involved in cell wall biosynthesis
MKISVIVTNYNGLHLLQKNLEQIILTSPQSNEIVVTDDCSTDDSLLFVSELQKKYHKLRIISHKSNLGFGKNSNLAVNSCQSDFVVLLNSDIYPHNNYLLPALKHLSYSKIFGVGFSEKGHENWANLFWKNGYIQYEPGTDISQPHISGWLSGGSSVIRKEYF